MEISSSSRLHNQEVGGDQEVRLDLLAPGLRFLIRFLLLSHL